MTMMLAPDLLDRRALALLALRDAFGRPVRSPVEVSADGVKVHAKADGTVAVLEAAGFEAYCAAFREPPASPAVGSRSIALDIIPADRNLQARRFVLKLPRDPDPSNADHPDSLFQAAEVKLLASALQRSDALACILRATVRREGDGALIGRALVRARSNNGKFEAIGVTDRMGEAALIFPDLPVAFAGAGANAAAELPAKVIVKVDPAKALFTPVAEALSPGRSASRDAGLVDPDELAGGGAPNFSGGVPVKLSAGTEPAVELEWKQP